jgi:integrase
VGVQPETRLALGRREVSRYCFDGCQRRKSCRAVALLTESGRTAWMDQIAEVLRQSDERGGIGLDDLEMGRNLNILVKVPPLPFKIGAGIVVEVTAARVAGYVKERLAVGKARATVNRELAALKRGLALAVEHDRLSSVPKIKLLAEAPPRQGFVSPANFSKILEALPVDLRDLARFGYLTGWRVGEIVTLAWSDVDREGRRITLRRERSKSGEPRTIPFVSTLADIIEARWKAREYQAPAGPGLSPFVFHRAGDPIKDFRGAWRKACTAAKQPGLLFHDLRRSAVRNLVAAGVDQAVAMRITGHKTASVFQRYRIVADDDVRAALERTEAANNRTPASNVVELRPEAAG